MGGRGASHPNTDDLGRLYGERKIEVGAGRMDGASVVECGIPRRGKKSWLTPGWGACAEGGPT